MSSYIGNQPSGQGQAERFIFTCTGTTPTITHDDDGLPIGYTVNHVSVYLNGVKQVIPTDVAASNGSTIVFASNLSVDDVVEVIALSTFDAATTEGTSIQSTGETGNVKFLGEDGDNSSSWKQIDSGSIASGAIDLAHMSSESVDEDNLHISNAGSNGEFLSKQSGNAGGLTWAAAGGGGTILQTLNFTNSYAQTNTGTTPADVEQSSGVDWEPSITPSATSSKVLITAGIPVRGYRSTGNDGRGSIRMLTDIAGAGYVEKAEWTEIIGAYDYGNSGIGVCLMICCTYLQAPITTGVFKVKFQFETNGSSDTTVGVNLESQLSTMTLQEISG